MTVSSVLGFVSLAGWLMVIAGVAIAITNASQNRSGRPGVFLAGVGLVIGLLFFIASTGLVEVGATEVAVVFQSVGGDPATHGLWPNPLLPGVHIIVPIINEPFIYSTEVQTYTMSKTPTEGQIAGDDSVSVLTSDGQQVSIDVSVLYSIDPAKANLVHLQFQSRYQDDFVRPTVRSVIRDTASGYTVEDLYGPKRTDMQQKAHDVIAAKFSDNGFILRDLPVRNIMFSDQFIKAIEAKQVASQQAQQAVQESERVRTLAKGQADAAVTAAQGQADAAVEQAKGDAQAIELRAAADAQALGLISEQLLKNPQLIEWRYIEKLAQDVRLVLVPSNSPFLFGMNGLQNGTPGSTTLRAASAVQSVQSGQPTAESPAATPQATATP